MKLSLSALIAISGLVDYPRHSQRMNVGMNGGTDAEKQRLKLVTKGKGLAKEVRFYGRSYVVSVTSYFINDSTSSAPLHLFNLPEAVSVISAQMHGWVDSCQEKMQTVWRAIIAVHLARCNFVNAR